MFLEKLVYTNTYIIYHFIHISLCDVYTDSIPVHKSQYGRFYGPILLDNLLCTGDETNLLKCTDDESIGNHNCDHSEDAGVICMQESQCEANSLRLIPTHMSGDDLYLDEGDLDDFYFIKDELHRGRVEVCIDGEWNSVCYDGQWGNEEATVACRQLGFSPFGKHCILQQTCIYVCCCLHRYNLCIRKRFCTISNSMSFTTLAMGVLCKVIFL